jgi:hypothetical protein
MRLSEWRASAPTRESMTLKVVGVIEPVLGALGADKDPTSWVIWGDDPGVRYTVLVPTIAGLITCGVRVNAPGEGPRASGRVVRWNRVQLGELTVETQAGHRVATFQVDQHVLRAGDATADRSGEFALALFAAADGRPIPAGRKSRSTRGKGAAAGRAPSKRAPRPAAKATARIGATDGERQPLQPAAGSA